jgi:hypothetical protein
MIRVIVVSSAGLARPVIAPGEVAALPGFYGDNRVNAVDIE